MIFGDKNSFALEINLIQGAGNVFGQYCYWVSGQMIGDLDQLTVLTAIIGDLEKIFEYKDHRGICNIDEVAADEIIEYLVLKLSGSGTSYSFKITDELIDKIHINYFKTPCLDGYYVFLIEQESFDWFLVKDIINPTNYSFKIPKGLYYKHINAAREWIRSSTVLTLKSV